MQLFKLVSQGGYTEKPNTRGIDKDSKTTSAKNSLESPTEFGYKCVCLNANNHDGNIITSDGNIITEGFLMAENLNEYFSSVFTREDISILPVLETKFEGREFDYV